MKRLFIIVLALTAGYLTIDHLLSAKNNLRQFDPIDVARLDTEMWRSYYDRRPVLLFGQLIQLMRKQYNASWINATRMAYYAGKAAFVFKEGKSRPDYEKALPLLTNYFTLLQRQSTEPFSVKEAARTELEWWIVHRQRKQYGRTALEKALSDEMAVIYHQPAQVFMPYARYRTEAMYIRDTRAETPEGVSNADWQRINQLLDTSWKAARQAANPTLATRRLSP